MVQFLLATSDFTPIITIDIAYFVGPLSVIMKVLQLHVKETHLLSPIVHAMQCLFPKQKILKLLKALKYAHLIQTCVIVNVTMFTGKIITNLCFKHFLE